MPCLAGGSPHQAKLSNIARLSRRCSTPLYNSERNARRWRERSRCILRNSESV